MPECVSDRELLDIVYSIAKHSRAKCSEDGEYSAISVGMLPDYGYDIFSTMNPTLVEAVDTIVEWGFERGCAAMWQEENIRVEAVKLEFENHATLILGLIKWCNNIEALVAFRRR